MTARKVVLVLAVCLFGAVPAQAQFGQNQVVYNNKEVLFYQSEHIDFYHWQDINDEDQIKYLAHVVDQAERSYRFLSGYLGHSLSKKPNLVFYGTHHEFTATRILGNHFIPEGILAFAMPTTSLPVRYVLAIKLDTSMEEYDATITHEMAHIFQFDMGPNILKRAVGSGPPNWIMEGGAEFLGNEYNSSRTDDLRGAERRGAGANPEKDLPTWLDLNEESADPYTFGAMTLQFIKEKYGEDVVKKFLVRAFKDGEDLVAVLAELTDGAVRSPERFDEAQRDYWREKFGPEMLAKPRPYQENEYFRGRHFAPAEYPYPIIAPVLSPDGKKTAFLTVSPKHGSVVVIVASALPREVQKYVPKLKLGRTQGAQKLEKEEWEIEILTPYLPPKHYEYIALGIQTPSLSWSRAGDKEYISFFAQSGKDHVLFIVDPNNKKNLKSVPIPLDNASSPAFSPDGDKVYFSASQNITRDIFAVDLNSGKIDKITNDPAYDESPAVSPDGTKIAYVSFVGFYRKLFVLDMSTREKKQLTYNSYNDLAPSFSDDGKTIVYTSDEKDGVSNIYTIDLDTNVVSQLTDFFGFSFTPRFARDEKDRIYYAHLWQYDQYRNFIGQNWELFEVLSKKPYRQYLMKDNSEPDYPVFIPEKDLFQFELDENQLLNPTPGPEKWSCSAGNVQMGFSSYWGTFGQSYVGCSNLLQTKQHNALFVLYGDFRILDYSYLNQKKRTTWLWNVNRTQMPLGYRFYDFTKGYPEQPLLKLTWVKETSFNLFTSYPLNKFNRVEVFSRLRNRSYTIAGLSSGAAKDIIDSFPGEFADNEVQLVNFFSRSETSNLSFGAAYVRDTVLYSNNTWGPFHGNALRAQIEFAPPVGNEFGRYSSVNVAARTYRHLGSSSLFAGRADVMANSRSNGDFMLLCGPDRLRGCAYGSIIGNQVGYVSGELRFPVPGTYILFTGVRGFLFADAAYARFSNEKFPAQKFGTYGFGLQYLLPFFGLPAQTVWTRDNDQWKPSFYITLNW